MESKKSRTIWILRHGNRHDFVYPEWFNTATRKYDPPLSDDGIIQAETLAEKLLHPNIKIDDIFCSPFLRAIQTAYPIAKNLNLPIKVEAGLGEWHNPNWMDEKPVTESIQELHEKYPLIDQNYQAQIIPQYPETLEDVQKRTATIANILTRQYCHNILFVGHSLSVRGIALGLLNKDQIINTPLCGLVKLNQDSDHNKWNLELNGDVSHLSHLPPPKIAQ